MGLIDSLQTALKAMPHVQLAVLFGSFAKGSADMHSDVDVAVLVAPNTVMNRIEVETTLGRVVQRGVDLIDLIDLTLAMPLLRFEVARDGVLIV